VRTAFERKEESNDAGEIRRQVEFYFSDSNLPCDAFLLAETGGHANKPVPIKTLHNFKRMRHFQPFSAVVEAIKGSDFLEVNDKDEVFRKVPLDSKFTDDPKENDKLLTTASMARSIYAKGFGEETDSSAFDIEEFVVPDTSNTIVSANISIDSSAHTASFRSVSAVTRTVPSRAQCSSNSRTRMPPSSSSKWRKSQSSTTRSCW
jgi:hypothetical protein